jgi:hypothetical protein
MKRRITPELLDVLPAQDPRALASRSDIHRLNRLMGNARIATEALRVAVNGRRPRRLVELGAGDGSFLFQLARRLASEWRGTTVTLLDRHDVVTAETREAFARLGWPVDTVTGDVFDWLRQSPPANDVIVANLFLHHFSCDQLAELLRASAAYTRIFVAVEPRRSAWALASSRLVGLLGCNRVTRHDAPASVRAGFSGHELSRLWPANAQWSLCEGSAGLFSHLFVARNKEVEIRNSKSEIRPTATARQRGENKSRLMEISKPENVRAFRFLPLGISEFEFVSEFGIRNSDFLRARDFARPSNLRLRP